MTKPKIQIPKTRAEMDGLVAGIASVLRVADRLALDQDRDLAAVRARYAPTVADCRKSLKPLMAAALKWANANPAEFGERRSIEFSQAIAGFRTGQPALGFASEEMTSESVIADLEARGLSEYVRIVREIDRERLIADRAKIGKETFAKLGLEVTQAERFFVDLKTEGRTP